MSYKTKLNMKYLLRSTISTFFYLVNSVKRREGIVVLTYHRVNDNLPPNQVNTPVEHFRKQMQYLRDHCQVISIADITEAENRIKLTGNTARPAVVITFDDGYRDNYLSAYPILKEYGLPACVFLITDMVATNKKIPIYRHMPDPDMLSWNEIQEMSNNGITFCSHTASHAHLSQLDYDRQKTEIKKSADTIHEKTNTDACKSIFCYPDGDYSKQTVDALNELGFKLAFTTRPGINNATVPPLEMRRTEISGVDNLFDFRKKLAGAFDWLHAQIQKRRRPYYGKVNVLHVLWSLGLGGGEQTVIHLIKGRNKERYTPILCCLDDEGEFAGPVKREGVKIYELNKRRGIDFSVIGKTIRIIKENDIGLVHTHMWGGNVWGRIAAKLAGVPVIIATEQNVDVWKKWYHKLIDRCLVRITDKIIVVSNQVKKFCEQQIGLPAKKLEVIYNCVPENPKITDKGYVKRIKSELGVSNGKPIIANIGRLVEQKANHIFIEALNILDNDNVEFNAFIIGDGHLRQSLEEQGKHLVDKGKLTFTGTRKDVQNILDITDISVLSSTREGSSVVICECMQKEVPVVATDVSGNDEQIINGKTGLLVPVNNPPALADAIKKLINDPALAKQMGQASRERAAKYFSVEVMVNATEHLYAELLNAKR